MINVMGAIVLRAFKQLRLFVISTIDVRGGCGKYNNLPETGLRRKHYCQQRHGNRGLSAHDLEALSGEADRMRGFRVGGNRF